MEGLNTLRQKHDKITQSVETINGRLVTAEQDVTGIKDIISKILADIDAIKNG